MATRCRKHDSQFVNYYIREVHCSVQIFISNGGNLNNYMHGYSLSHHETKKKTVLPNNFREHLWPMTIVMAGFKI